MKKIFILLNILLFAFCLQGQTVHEDSSFTLSDSIGGDVIYKAKEFTKFSPGFKYTANANESFLSLIDLTVVAPPTGGTTGGPGGEVGNTGVVGAISGNLSIDPTGGASYNIPIYIPPGTSGMAPELSILYNSNGGDGLLGPKWAIGGLSEISETRRHKFGDYYGYGTEYSEYILDGSRLHITKKAGFEAIEYSKESETFEKIKKHNTDPNHYFTCTTKSGLTKTYGGTPDSRTINSYSTTPSRFLISKIEDNLGNYIEFEYYYDHANGENYPKEIRYTGNTNESLSPYNKIEFIYENRNSSIVNRNDRNNSMELRSINTVSKKLIEIKCWSESNVLRRYEINYTERGGAGTEYITSVQELGLNNTHYNKTVFTWNEIPNYLADSLPTHQLNFTDDGFLTSGDFNGDGKNEFIFTDKDNGYVGVFFYNMDSETFTPMTSLGLPHFNDFPAKAIVGDFNGDGASDVIFSYCYITESQSRTMKYDLRWGQINEFTKNPNTCRLSTTPYVFYEYDFNNNIYQEPIVGEFNGDGITDIIFRTDDATGNLKVFLGSGANNLAHDPTHDLDDETLPDSYKYYTGDFNNDGKTDFFLKQKNGYDNMFKVSKFDAEDWYSDYFTSLSYEYNAEVLIADMNFDGKSDIITIVSDSIFRTYHCEGIQFKKVGTDTIPKDCFSPPPYTTEGIGIDSCTYTILDYNLDGRPDIKRNYHYYKVDTIYTGPLTYEFAPTLTFSYNYLISNAGGDSFSNEFFVEDIDKQYSTILDINMDGYPDMISGGDIEINGDNEFDHQYWDDDFDVYISNAKPNLISSIKDGMGIETKITYKLLGDPIVYNRDRTLTTTKTHEDELYSPVSLFTQSMPLVYMVENENHLGSFDTIQYYYEKARVHKKGKGFLGFTSISSTDTKRNIQNITRNWFDWTYYWVRPWEVITNYTGDTLLNEVINYAYEDIDYNSRHGFYVYPDFIKKTSKIPHGGENALHEAYDSKVEISTMTVDSYGNSTTSNKTTESTTDGRDEVFTESVVNEYTNITDNDKWILGRLTKSTVTKSATGKSNIVVSSAFEYFPADSLWEGMLWKEIVEPTDSLAQTKTYQYDNFGNIIKTTTSAAGVNNRVLYSYYDHNKADPSKRRFLTKTVNTIGHEVSTVYDDHFGIEVEKIGLNGLSVEMQYDDFGNKIQTNAPDGSISKATVRWVDGDTDAPQNALYYTWSQSSGGTETKVFFDKVGNELRRVSIGFGGKKIYSDIIYDDLGRVIKTSNPYFVGEQVLYTENTYDYLNRILTTTNPNNLTVKYSYRTGVASIIDNITTKRKTVNAMGQVVKVQTPVVQQ